MSLKKDNEKAFNDLCNGLLGAFMSPESIMEMVKFAGISKINAMNNAELGLFIKQMKAANERPAAQLSITPPGEEIPTPPRTRHRRSNAEVAAAKAAAATPVIPAPYIDPITDKPKSILGGESMPQAPIIGGKF
jgi:hypothetical protein